jgi:hypothetical protein
MFHATGLLQARQDVWYHGANELRSIVGILCRTFCLFVSSASDPHESVMQDVATAPSLGGNGPFQAVTLPEGGTRIVVLPRWNIVALAKRPTALSIKDVSEIPQIAASQPVQRVCILLLAAHCHKCSHSILWIGGCKAYTGRQLVMDMSDAAGTACRRPTAD